MPKSKSQKHGKKRASGRRSRPADIEPTVEHRADGGGGSDDSDAAPTPRAALRKASGKTRKKSDPYEITLVMMDPDFIEDDKGNAISIDDDWICNKILEHISSGVYVRSLVRLLKYDPDEPRKLPKAVTGTPAVYDHEEKRYYIGPDAVDHFHAWVSDRHNRFIDLEELLFGNENAAEYELGVGNGYAERKKKRLRSKARIKGERIDEADVMHIDRPLHTGAAVRGDEIASTQLRKGLAPPTDKLGRLPVFDIGDRPDVRGARRGGNRVIKAKNREDKKKITDADIEKAMRRRQRATDRRKGTRTQRTQSTLDDVSDDGHSYSDDDDADFKKREKQRRKRYAKARRMMNKGGHARQQEVGDEEYDSDQEYEMDDRERRKRGRKKNRGRRADASEEESEGSSEEESEERQRGRRTDVVSTRTSRFEHDSDDEEVVKPKGKGKRKQKGKPKSAKKETSQKKRSSAKTEKPARKTKKPDRKPKAEKAVKPDKKSRKRRPAA